MRYSERWCVYPSLGSGHYSKLFVWTGPTPVLNWVMQPVFFSARQTVLSHSAKVGGGYVNAFWPFDLKEQAAQGKLARGNSVRSACDAADAAGNSKRMLRAGKRRGNEHNSPTDLGSAVTVEPDVQ